jgi:hypothetical protein
MLVIQSSMFLRIVRAELHDAGTSQCAAAIAEIAGYSAMRRFSTTTRAA